MMRTLAVASAVGLAAVSMSWSAAVLALGLGDVDVRSRLNERFVATIPLDAATPEDLESLVVKIASPEEFARRGVDRSELINTLRFERIGSRIQVASAQAIRDPFMNFIVEARWNGGRLLREYTVLLDPPGSAPPPAASAPAATVAAPTPLPLPTAATAAATAERPERYGPVQPAQTLWSIAKLFRRDPAVTMDQMLLAIYNGNPTAFGGGSINHLLSGEVLVVPSTAEALAIDAATAHDRVTQLRAGGASGAVAAAVAVPKPAAAHPIASPEPASVSAPPPATSVPAPELSEPPQVAVTAGPQADAGAGEVPASPAVDAEAPPAAPAPAGVVAADTPVAAAAEAAVPVVAASPSVNDPVINEDLLPLALIGGLLLLIVALLVLRRRQGRDADAKKGPAASREMLPPGPDLLLEQPWTRAPVVRPAVDASAAEEVPTAAPARGPELSRRDHDSAVAAPVAPPAITAAADLGPSLDAGDPLTEADFHLAYGLYDEAAQMLQKAIAAAPERGELKMKLAETYSAAGNAPAFQTLAEGMIDKVTPGDWQKLSVMGRALLPESPLFGGVPSEAPAEPSPDLSVIDFDLDVDLSGNEPPTDAMPAPPPVDMPLVAIPDPVTESLLRPLDEPIVEFDLPPATLPAPPIVLVEPEPLPPLPPVAVPAAEVSPAPLDIDLSSFDLDDDFSGARVDAGLVKPAQPFLEIPIDESAFTVDPEPESEVIGGDEIDTKLDLARAYADMGDLDAARTLLAEVEISGSDRQQQEARALSQRLQG
ncbi:MAG: hypothetical protein C0434_14725 [Xanthomonadaceae bacterium]|nr:hypothetical protein [Xanthomonadaceae bacterium]